MSLLPTTGSFLPNSGQNVDIAAKFEAWLAATKQMPGGSAAGFLSIVGGAVTPTAWHTAVDVEGGSEGGLTTDDLDQISPVNLPDGAVICLRPRATGRTVVIRHNRGGAGQIFTPDGQSYAMTDSSQHWFGVLAPDRLSWTEIMRSWGDRTSAFRTWLGLSTAATYPVATEAEVRAGTLSNKLVTPQGVAWALSDANLAFIDRPFVSTYAAGDQLTVLRETSPGVFGIRRTGLSILLQHSFIDSFTSGEIAISNGGGGTITSHGLGVEPTSIEVFIRCKITEHGYPAGIVQRYMGEKFVVAPNAVGLFYRFANESQPITLRDLTTGAAFSATNANWRMFIRLRR